MSRINDLIKELCPNGVIYKKYGDVFEIKTGKGITTKEATDDGLYPIISGGTTPMGYYHSYNRDENIVTVSRVGANAGYVNFITEKFYLNDKCFSIIPKDEFVKCFIPKYIYYYTKNIENKIMELQSEGGVPTINTQKVSNLLMPMLPIDVQLEIINILDKFGGLEAELEAELEARKSQYEFWRGKVFNRDKETIVTLETIGDVTKLAGFEFSKYVHYSDEGNVIALRGLNVKNGHLVLDDVKYVDNSDFSKLNRSKLYENDILYTYVGTVGQVGLVDKNDKYYLAPNVARIRIFDKKVNPKYVMHFLLTAEFKINQLESLSGTSSMKNITMTNIRKFKIPVPSLQEQERVVNILDKFDALVNDITEGIPAEIELRRQQYEYYRNKLLSFEEFLNE